jgi:hypothetical protein
MTSLQSAGNGGTEVVSAQTGNGDGTGGVGGDGSNGGTSVASSNNGSGNTEGLRGKSGLKVDVGLGSDLLVNVGLGSDLLVPPFPALCKLVIA